MKEHEWNLSSFFITRYVYIQLLKLGRLERQGLMFNYVVRNVDGFVYYTK